MDKVIAYLAMRLNMKAITVADITKQYPKFVEAIVLRAYKDNNKKS